MESSDGLHTTKSPRAAAGWDTGAKAGKLVSELLTPSGTRVVPLDDVAGLVAADDTGPEWPHRVWERLRAAHRLDDTDAVLVLRQNAIDSMGRQYSPAADFLTTGLLGLAYGAATREDRFQPSFILAVHQGFQAFMVGPSRCSIGFDARLVDARSGRLLSQADGVLGQESLPKTFQAETLTEMPEQDRQVVETYCIAALRRGISQAINDLDLVAH